MDSASALMWGVLFGSIGLAYFIYGKKQKAIIPVISGIGLMVLPYFVANIYMMLVSAVVLMALPYFKRE